MLKVVCGGLVAGMLLLIPAAASAGQAEHVVLIVWDGMRPDFVSAEHTPALLHLARDGVCFQNHHAVYCSATEVNGTALATGAYPEHSGVIANYDYRPDIGALKPVNMQELSVVRKGDRVTGGRYLRRSTLAEILQAAGKSTAVSAAKQVGLLHDRRERADDYHAGVVLAEGKALPASLISVTNRLGNFPASASTRSSLTNERRDQWATRALLEELWSNGVPAFSLLWLSEPDFSQHANGPGSPRALAALESCDRKLAAVLAELDRRGLRGRTDVFVVSDHGFSTVERSVDVAKLLRDAGFNAQREFKAPPGKGDILVAGQGGSMLFYVGRRHSGTIRRLVEFLQQQDFAGPILTRERVEGAFTLDRALLETKDPPDVVMSLRWSTNASGFGAAGQAICDGSRRPGEGSHASLSRFDLHNTLAAAGPDLKTGFVDTLPTGNIDLAPTILWLLDVEPPKRMDGRVLSEALTVAAPAVSEPVTRRFEARRAFERSVWSQYLQVSEVNDTVYLDEGNAVVERQK